jgi:hypothetical protein
MGNPGSPQAARRSPPCAFPDARFAAASPLRALRWQSGGALRASRRARRRQPGGALRASPALFGGGPAEIARGGALRAARRARRGTFAALHGDLMKTVNEWPGGTRGADKGKDERSHHAMPFCES